MSAARDARCQADARPGNLRNVRARVEPGSAPITCMHRVTLARRDFLAHYESKWKLSDVGPIRPASSHAPIGLGLAVSGPSLLYVQSQEPGGIVPAQYNSVIGGIYLTGIGVAVVWPDAVDAASNTTSPAAHRICRILSSNASPHPYAVARVASRRRCPSVRSSGRTSIDELRVSNRCKSCLGNRRRAE